MIAVAASAKGGPESSTAPPGSTVTTLPPGSGGNAAMTEVTSFQPGRRIGSARSWQCASISRPTPPTGPSIRHPATRYSAAASALSSALSAQPVTWSQGTVRAISAALSG